MGEKKPNRPPPTVSGKRLPRSAPLQAAAPPEPGAEAPVAPTQQHLEEALIALHATLQEVEIAEQELAQQNEELIAAREALEIERFRYRELFELAPVGYVITDLGGIVEEANQAAGALLRINPTGLRGKPLAVFVAPPERPEFRGLLSSLEGGAPQQEVELELMPAAAGPRSVLVTVVRDEAKPDRTVRLRWVLRDISERKAAEEALRATEDRLRHSQRLESIGRLAGGVAHSFNNLLASIAFHADLLSGIPAGEELEHHADEIRKAGERAASLARQLLAFSRKQVVQPRLLRLDEVIGNLEPMVQRLIGEHIAMKTAFDPGAGAVEADPGQIEQVVLNLAVNARDAMPSGGVLTLRTGRLDIASPGNSDSPSSAAGGAGDPGLPGSAGEPGAAGSSEPHSPPGTPGLTGTSASSAAAGSNGKPRSSAGLREHAGLAPGSYVTLSVSDTGIGMNAETLARIFEPFFTTKGRDQGTGLGLATVYGIVRQSGGEVRVESTPGEGSVFTLYFPRAGEAAEAPEILVVSEVPARGSEIVLLVEDEQNIREPAAEILRSRGYEVLAAADAAEALAIARGRTGPIHLLLTDVIMPGMNGGQLAAELRAVLPGMRVIYISGYPENALALQGTLPASESFLQKPCTAVALLRTVRKVLDATG
jgi:PAS domain S-box-containing protein